MATKILTAHFSISGTPVVGLTPTIDIYELDPAVPTNNPMVVSGDPVIEIGGGWYRYQFITYNPSRNYVFTFDGGASLPGNERYKIGGNESYEEEITDSVWNEPSLDHQIPGSTGEVMVQTKADTTTILMNQVTITALINTVLKYSRNRTKIDLPAAQMIIYDDDGVTPLTTFNLLDFNGMPNVQEVCEKVPE